MIVDNIFISAKEVEYLTSETNYTYIHFINGVCLLSAHNIGKITAHLNFTRVHNRVAVNPVHIVSIKEGVIQMKSGFEVEPSRRKKEVLLTLGPQKGSRQFERRGI